jgi:hypothetical protein
MGIVEGENGHVHKRQKDTGGSVSTMYGHICTVSDV